MKTTPMLTHAVTPDELLAEVLALRPEIERILADEPGPYNAACIADKMQTVLLNICRHLDTYEPHAEGPRPWVARIAENVKRDAQRARKRHVAAFGHEQVDPDEIQCNGACPEHRARAHQLLRKVIPVIMTMPEPLRTVLVLVVFVGLDHKAVATKLDISNGNTRTRLVRAHEYIRERFGSLDKHLAVLAPIPVMDDDNHQSLPRRALILTGQFVHLWPPFLVGALVLAQIEMPMSIETSIDTTSVTQSDPPKLGTNLVINHSQHDALVVLHTAQQPRRPQRRPATPEAIEPKRPTAVPEITLDAYTHAVGGGSSSPGSSQ